MVNILLDYRKGRINILMLYFIRYFRLTPLLGISFLFSMSLMRFMGSGPLWPTKIDMWSQSCERYWWSALLYIQNYVNITDLVSTDIYVTYWISRRYVLLSFPVFSSFLVFVSWYATLHHLTSNCVFDLSLQSQIAVHFGTARSGLCGSYFTNSFKIRYL